MRASTVRAIGLALSIVAICGTIAPGRAASTLPTLKCSWSGTAFEELTGSEDMIIVSLGPGHGECRLDGSGPYVITAMTGEGYSNLENIPIFHLSVDFEIRRVSDGQLRFFHQSWDGVLDLAPKGVFIVEGNKSVGVGTEKGVGRLGPEDPVSFNWIFV